MMLGVERTAGGEGAADARLALLLAQRRRWLRHFVRAIGSWDDAEDLLGELTLCALRRPMPPDGDAMAWLYRQARHLISGYQERRGRDERCRVPDAPAGDAMEADEVAERHTERAADPGPGPELTALARLTEDQITAALARLGARQRRLLLALASGDSIRRLAGRRRVPRQVLMRQVLSARRALLDCLPPDLAAEVRVLLARLSPDLYGPPRTPEVVAPRRSAIGRLVDGGT
jgi:DNA-directed RNA polymerase specialized sigma24 family protein